MSAREFYEALRDKGALENNRRLLITHIYIYYHSTLELLLRPVIVALDCLLTIMSLMTNPVFCY